MSAQVIRVASTPHPRPTWVDEDCLASAREHITEELRRKTVIGVCANCQIDFVGVPEAEIGSGASKCMALVVFTREDARYENIRRRARSANLIHIRLADQNRRIDAPVPPTTLAPRSTVFFDSRKNGLLTAFVGSTATPQTPEQIAAAATAARKAKAKARARAAPRAPVDRDGRPIPPPAPPTPQWAVARPWWEL
jgi:hypothetical protein